MSDIYITRAELAKPPFEVLTTTDIGDMQNWSKELVDLFCGQSFDQEGDTGSEVEKLVDGTGKDTIFMPKRLITLESIKIYSSSTNYTSYNSDNFRAEKWHVSWNIYSSVLESIRLRVENFSEGNSNIGVVGIWGWADYPEAIKYLQCKLIKSAIEDKSFALKFISKNLGDFSWTKKDGSGGISITGDAEMDSIIMRYRPPEYFAI